MKLSHKERLVSTPVIAVLALVLLALAVMQYRWSREVSEAASVRMQANLHSSVMNWRQDFYRELGSVLEAMRPLPGGEYGPEDAAQRYAAWKRTAVHPGLVDNVYVWESAAGRQGGGGTKLLRLNWTTTQFEASEWPSGFEPLRERLGRGMEMVRNGPRRIPPPHREEPHEGGSEHPPRMMGGPWLAVTQDVPALVYPVVHRDREFTPKQVDWYILQLDQSVLRQHIFPELAERYFGGDSGLAYRVAVINGPTVLYSSDANFGAKDVGAADVRMPIFGPPFGPALEMVRMAGQRPGMQRFGPAPGEGMPPHPAERRPDELHRAGLPPGLWFEAMRYPGGPSDWLLVVQNRRGPLETIAASMRRRNLALSFGILLVLAATLAILIMTTHRAQRLARLQMDFVTGVSHELRTPLAVISSAAENIADGVVDNQEQMARYGNAIKTQARQLTHLVEQILLFAATREQRYQYQVRVLQAREIVEHALAATAGLLKSAEFEVEEDISPDLPAVRGDLTALSQCVQNLITNAVKYGGAARWIAVRARRSDDEVQISVEDKGGGIASDELGMIFEPFYRSPSAAQIHGTGLGLPLARSIAEAMGGRLTASSEPGRGSCFVLHLPTHRVIGRSGDRVIEEAGDRVIG